MSTMAAIIETHRIVRPTPRPALRLVTTDGRTSAPVPVGLGLTAGHLLAIVVATAVVVVATLGLGSGWFRGLAPAGPPASAAAASSAGATVVTVRPGDSLWSIARRLQPTGDVRALVDRLLEANGSRPLQPGDRVVIPG
jgi:hypothetical protein